jgi:hypothetical protein
MHVVKTKNWKVERPAKKDILSVEVAETLVCLTLAERHVQFAKQN